MSPIQAPEKPWWQSKILWTGVVLFLLGAVPVFQDLFAHSPIDVQAVLEAVAGLLTVVWRIWFTDTKLV